MSEQAALRRTGRLVDRVRVETPFRQGYSGARPCLLIGSLEAAVMRAAGRGHFR